MTERASHESLLAIPTGPLVVPAAPSPALRVSVVVPTFDEAANIEALLDELAPLLEAAWPGAHEILVVDDDSPDGTWRVALEVARRLPVVRVLRRSGERGLSTAVVRGWQAARGEVLAVIDGDRQHPPAVVVALAAAVLAGADLAVASRNVPGGGVSDWSVSRRALSRGAQLLGLMLLPRVVGAVTDPMSGYFAVRRSALEGVVLSPLGYKILLEVLARGRIGAIREIPYVFREREDGASKVTYRQYVDYLLHLGRLRAEGLGSQGTRRG